MKKNVIILGLFSIVLLWFSSCSENLDSLSPASITLKQEPFKGTLTLSLNPKDFSQDDPYRVSYEDVINFSKSLRPNKECNVDIYKNENDTLLYLLNYGDEWIVVAGDKGINPFVAESKEDAISFDTPNENLKAYLDSYADEIRIIRKDPKVIENEYTKFWGLILNNKPKIESKTRNPEYKWAVNSYTYLDSETSSVLIPHLVLTKWGQNSPWNNCFPTDANHNNNKCKTGCASVAFGQLLYYTHYHLGKPSGLYHSISVSSSILGPTSNINYSPSNWNSNSNRWGTMALSGSSSNTGLEYDYVGYLMMDIGNNMNMIYCADYGEGDLSSNAASNYNLTYSLSSYNYQLVKKDLQNSKPVYTTAYSQPNHQDGHAWLIDGLGEKTRHYIIQKSFEYTENWMYSSEYFDTFDELRARYHINSEYDIVEEDGGYVTTEYLFMNWGQDGSNDGGYYSTYPTSTWTFYSIPSYNFQYDKRIKYDFR